RGTLRRVCKPKEPQCRRWYVVSAPIDRDFNDPFAVIDLESVSLLHEAGYDGHQLLAVGAKPRFLRRRASEALAFGLPCCAGDLLVGPVVAKQRLQPVDSIDQTLLPDTDLGTDLGEK